MILRANDFSQSNEFHLTNRWSARVENEGLASHSSARGAQLNRQAS
jgi:hypothetical protein